MKKPLKIISPIFLLASLILFAGCGGTGGDGETGAGQHSNGPSSLSPGIIAPGDGFFDPFSPSDDHGINSPGDADYNPIIDPDDGDIPDFGTTNPNNRAPGVQITIEDSHCPLRTLSLCSKESIGYFFLRNNDPSQNDFFYIEDLLDDYGVNRFHRCNDPKEIKVGHLDELISSKGELSCTVLQDYIVPEEEPLDYATVCTFSLLPETVKQEGSCLIKFTPEEAIEF
jgi:hypothetical protein